MSNSKKEEIPGRLKLLASALEYIDTTTGLEYIVSKCTDYARLKQKMAAFRFLLEIDPAELTDLNVELGNMVLNFPNRATQLFQEVVYTAIECLELLPNSVSKSQIQVVLRLQALPSLPLYMMQGWGGVRGKTSKNQQFVKFEGIVCGMTTPTKYTQSARYICPVGDCPGCEGNLYIRLHVAGAREVTTISNNFICSYCSTPLQEDAACRILSDKIVIEMVDEKAFSGECKVNKTRFQAMTVFARDELTAIVRMGEQYSVIGCLAYEPSTTDNISFVFEANNIIQQGSAIPRRSVIPGNIHKLFSDRLESPWSFALSLAYLFGDKISPPGTFLHLKLGILLSLVGSNPSGSVHDHMNFLVIGHDSLILHRLLVFATGFVDRAVQYTSINNLVGIVTKDKHGTGTPFIEGGSLLQAGSGVCYLGDVGQLNKTSKEALQKALESGRVSLTIPSRLSNGLPQQMLYPLNCDVWAYTELLTPKHPSEGAMMQTTDAGNISKTLADVFGMLYFTDTEGCNGSYGESLLVQHTFLTSQNEDNSPASSIITEDEMREYVNIVKHRVVEFTQEAETLIRGYYIGSRRVRAASVQGSHFPLTAVQTLTSLATAHAKLSLREFVLPEDALMAILLYEESMVARFGTSVLSVRPLCHVLDDNLSAYLGPENDCKMRQFHDMLLRFCATHAGDVHMEE